MQSGSNGLLSGIFHNFLWEAFQDKKFEKEKAVRVLKERTQDDEKSINTIISELKKSGRLEIMAHTDDARKSIYRLKPPENIRDILSKNELTRSDIYSLLKKAADLIRTRVDYKFILILLFL